MKFFKEKDLWGGGYGCYDPELQSRPGIFECRATAIEGQVSSVCTTGISIEWLERCTDPIEEKEVPKEWLEMLIGSQERAG